MVTKSERRGIIFSAHFYFSRLTISSLVLIDGNPTSFTSPLRTHNIFNDLLYLPHSSSEERPNEKSEWLKFAEDNAKGNYFFFMSDLSLLGPHTLSSLIFSMSNFTIQSDDVAKRHIGVVGPLLLTEDEEVFSAGISFFPSSLPSSILNAKELKLNR